MISAHEQYLEAQIELKNYKVLRGSFQDMFDKCANDDDFEKAKIEVRYYSRKIKALAQRINTYKKKIKLKAKAKK